MGARFLQFMIFLAIFSLLFGGVTIKPAEAQEGTTWTYMVYMSGDSSLASNIPDDIQEMEKVGSGNGLEILVLSDAAGEDDSALARILQGNLEELSLSDIDPSWGGELMMGEPDTLSKFVIWAAENYPADHYVLDLWGHGKGWTGVCPDKGNYLECHEIREAMEDISGAGIHLDMVSMDACQMGMVEVAYELRGAADYALLSEKDIPLDGWPYDRILEPLKSNPNMTAERLGMKMIDEYFDWGIVSSHYSLTLGLIDLGEMENLTSAIDDYSLEAAKMMGYFNPEFKEARELTEEYDGLHQYDLGHLLANINAQTKCLGLRALANEIGESLENAVAYEQHWTNVGDEPADHASGLSIWFPSYAPPLDYGRCGFANDTSWDEFVDEFASFYFEPERQEISYQVLAQSLDQDGNSLKDAILLDYEANPAGTTTVEIYGPNEMLVDSFELDTSSAGSRTIQLESYGSYEVAFYLRNQEGILLNYSVFDQGLAKEGVSIIRGQVLSDIGRGLNWVQVALVDEEGKILASTNTDSRGNYLMEIVVPTVTDGSNLTLVCGLGDNQQNITIGALSDNNIINFQVSSDIFGIEWITYASLFSVIVGFACLAIWGLTSRRREELPTALPELEQTL